MGESSSKDVPSPQLPMGIVGQQSFVETHASLRRAAEEQTAALALPGRTQWLPRTSLLGDYGAGDAVTRVAGRIGLHVVSLGVNHQRSAAVGEQGVGFAAGSQHDRVILYRGLRGAVGLHREIGHVPGMMAAGIEHAVLLVVRIEMRTGRLEVGRIALGVLMEVQRVLAGRQVLYVELDFDAFARRVDSSRADAIALG